MDKKGLLLVYIIALILTFIINVLLNIALPAIGNNVSIFLTVSMLCMIFAWSYEEEKTSYIYTTGANSVILLFVFFTGSAIYETMNSLKLEPSFGNYLMVIFGFGIKNFSLSSIFSLPGVFWFMIFNYAAVYVINTINRNILFLRNKVKEAMNNIKEINKYKTDIERYEKTIEELQNKVVELSSRTLVLKDFASEIGSSFEPKEIFNSIIEATIKLLDAEQTMVLVFDRNKKLRISASHNIDPEEAKKLSVNASDGIIGMILKNHSIITREDIDKNFQLSELYKMDNVEIQIAAPIESEERQIYAVLVINRMKNRISKEHIRMFSILLNIATLSLENSKLFKKVEFMANVDGLTKLYTHRFFQEFLSEEIARATRYKRSLTVVMSDIDHFKVFNDTYGHQTGDIVLEGVARVFKASVRNKVDLVARYGGEEFIAVLPETDIDAGLIVAERIRKNVEKTDFKGEKGEIHKVTVSIGMSTFPVHSTERLDLIKKADTALYYAKESGRNQVQVFNQEKMEIVEK